MSNLLRVREALERMIAQLQAEAELSASDEQRLRRGRRALRALHNEYLPWARSPGLTAARAAEIVFRVKLAWNQLHLERYEGK